MVESKGCTGCGLVKPVTGFYEFGGAYKGSGKRDGKCNY